MTEREIIERVRALCRLADRLKMPGHRHSAESAMADQDEVRNGLRIFHRDLTGTWPGQDGAAPALRPPPTVPAAVLRHRERVQRRPARTA